MRRGEKLAKAFLGKKRKRVFGNEIENEKNRDRGEGCDEEKRPLPYKPNEMAPATTPCTHHEAALRGLKG